MGKTFIVDADKCTACQLCVIACKDEHVGRGYAPWSAPQPDTGQFWIRIESKERGHIPRVRVTHLADPLPALRRRAVHPGLSDRRHQAPRRRACLDRSRAVQRLRPLPEGVPL